MSALQTRQAAQRGWQQEQDESAKAEICALSVDTVFVGVVSRRMANHFFVWCEQLLIRHVYVSNAIADREQMFEEDTIVEFRIANYVQKNTSGQPSAVATTVHRIGKLPARPLLHGVVSYLDHVSQIGFIAGAASTAATVRCGSHFLISPPPSTHPRWAQMPTD